MNVADIRHLYDYNAWANALYFDAAAALTPEQLQREIVSSYPSVRATLAHIAGAEWIWIERLLGNHHTQPPEWYGGGDLDLVRAELLEVERKRDGFLAVLSEARLGEFLDYRNMAGHDKRGRIASLLVHVVNHSTYHRGQVATMIRQLGGKPPASDMVVYDQL